MRKLSVLLALLLAVMPLSAQQVGEQWREPVRKVEVIARDSLYVTYRVLESEASPSTVGRTYKMLLSSWKLVRTDSVVVEVPPPPDPVPVPAKTNMYFNSNEAGCGTDPNVLMCDDFEDGVWYEKNCDVANASGGLLQTDGWCGTIYAAAQLAAGTARCGNVGFRSACAATTGVFNGAGNMADHALLGGIGVNEVWVRFYTKPLTGYVFGAEKMVTFNDGGPGKGGIDWGNLSWNCAGLATSTGRITMGFPVPQDECAGLNLGGAFPISAGNWYYYEVHFKLSSPGGADGVFELWLDNCGPNGLTCPQLPTLRMRRTNIKSNRQSTSQLIRVIWLEAWSNPQSKGERYWDQIQVSKAPIGMMK